MARTGITEQQVFDAANQLAQEGQAFASTTTKKRLIGQELKTKPKPSPKHQQQPRFFSRVAVF